MGLITPRKLGGLPLSNGGWIDYRELGRAVAEALRENPPVVGVDDTHSGLLANKRRNGSLGLS